MDEYRDAIASCCRQLRLSANLVDNAMSQSGESHQEYLYNLLSEEIRYRKATRVAKLVIRQDFPYSTILRPSARMKYSSHPVLPWIP